MGPVTRTLVLFMVVYGSSSFQWIETISVDSEVGTSVALDMTGSVLVSGAPEDDSYRGAAFIWNRPLEEEEFEPPQKYVQPLDASGRSRFGTRVQVSSDSSMVFVAGPADNGLNGAIWAFQRQTTETAIMYKQFGRKMVPQDVSRGGQMGFSLDTNADGTVICAGAPSRLVNQGGVYVFAKGNGGFAQQGDVLFGQDVSPPKFSFPQQGISCSLCAEGDTLAVGGSLNEEEQGAVWIFHREKQGNWSQAQSMIEGLSVGSRFGTSTQLSASGNVLVVGAPGGPFIAGEVFVFLRSSRHEPFTRLSQLTGSSSPQAHFQGLSLSLSRDGRHIAWGAPGDDIQGAAFVAHYDYAAKQFQVGNALRSPPGNETEYESVGLLGGRQFGTSIALSGDGVYLCVGAPLYGDSAGSVSLFKSSTEQTIAIRTKGSLPRFIPPFVPRGKNHTENTSSAFSLVPSVACMMIWMLALGVW